MSATVFHIKMNKSYSSEISDDFDEYPEVTQNDINRAVFRIGRIPASSSKQQITILPDTVLVEYFRIKAGDDDFQRLINDTLRKSVEYENLEDTIRRVIREELHSGN
ncbi:MAG: toxin-antitoxin system antitoxin subunit [Desulfococcaceae bacterium]|jgi:uncharacterized protein (DUF4415 family)|nr:toxin-antitoxin system antitoxin subunit [Desulfococcaceae bacterium]